MCFVMEENKEEKKVNMENKTEKKEATTEKKEVKKVTKNEKKENKEVSTAKKTQDANHKTEKVEVATEDPNAFKKVEKNKTTEKQGCCPAEASAWTAALLHSEAADPVSVVTVTEASVGVSPCRTSEMMFIRMTARS